MTETTHMELKRDREFGELISDLIDLFRENFKPLISIYLRYGLSILLVGFLFGLIYTSMYTASDSLTGLLSMVGGLGNLIFSVFNMIAVLSMTAAIYSYVQGYSEGGIDLAK